MLFLHVHPGNVQDLVPNWDTNLRLPAQPTTEGASAAPQNLVLVLVLWLTLLGSCKTREALRFLTSRCWLVLFYRSGWIFMFLLSETRSKSYC